jgi:hypothetical protein
MGRKAKYLMKALRPVLTARTAVNRRICTARTRAESALLYYRSFMLLTEQESKGATYHLSIPSLHCPLAPSRDRNLRHENETAAEQQRRDEVGEREPVGARCRKAIGGAHGSMSSLVY